MAAEIISKNIEQTELKSLESREKFIRQEGLKEVGPELASFFLKSIRP